MARRGENIHYRKIDGRWEGRVVVGKKPDGTTKFKSVYGNTYNEAKQKMRQTWREIGREPVPLASGGTFRELVQKWLEDAKPHVKQSTHSYYTGQFRKHILPTLGERAIDKFTAGELQSFINSLMKKGLSAGTIHGIVGLFKRVLKETGGAASLCGGVKLPERETPEVQALNKRQRADLEEAALKSKDGLAVLLALDTGLRIGEISALKHTDIDMKRGVIRVSRTAQRISVHDEEGSTRVISGKAKTKHSIREVPLTDRLKEMLEDARAANRSVFVVSCKGGMAEPRVIRYRFERIAKKAGLERTKFHTLRKTFATRAMETGADIATLSKLLGHASAKMTLDRYTASTWEQKQKVIHRMENANHQSVVA